jgi:DMSO reductase anchor subunit
VHPAYSVILFTTASGAGYGLLALLGLGALARGPAESLGHGLAALVVALGLVTFGLLSSTFHLGHPERAWRAFSQWRSSWLSREGVTAVASYAVAGLFALAWLFPESVPLPLAPLGVALAAISVVTVYCTAMIYASLPTIRQWHHPLVVPGYLALALATGACLWLALAGLFGLERPIAGPLAAAACLLAIGVKRAYWQAIDADEGRYTAGQATGLGHLGEVRQWEAPHTSENFVMKEMGHRVARAHSARLRRLALGGLGVAAAAAALAALAPAWLAGLLGLVAALVALAAALVERWLFFADAQHVVTLYYGAARA